MTNNRTGWGRSVRGTVTDVSKNDHPHQFTVAVDKVEYSLINIKHSTYCAVGDKVYLYIPAGWKNPDCFINYGLADAQDWYYSQYDGTKTAKNYGFCGVVQLDEEQLKKAVESHLFTDAVNNLSPAERKEMRALFSECLEHSVRILALKMTFEDTKKTMPTLAESVVDCAVEMTVTVDSSTTQYLKRALETPAPKEKTSA